MNRKVSVIFLIMLVAGLLGTSICASAQNLDDIDSVVVMVEVENDTIYSLDLKYFVESNIKLGGKNQTFAVYRGYGSDRNFWLGTASLTIGAAIFTHAAWSDPVVYIESHSHYTRDYFNKAITKRNIKIAGGMAFTGLAVYFYSKLRKKKVKWVVGPDGIKYTF